MDKSRADLTTEDLRRVSAIMSAALRPLNSQNSSFKTLYGGAVDLQRAQDAWCGGLMLELRVFRSTVDEVLDLLQKLAGQVLPPQLCREFRAEIVKVSGESADAMVDAFLKSRVRCYLLHLQLSCVL
jgi:hypothetical protein